MRLRSGIIFLLLALLAVISSGCVSRKTPAGRGTHETITLAGSTSVQPFAELIAEEFMALHPDVAVNVQGGGSSSGARAVITGVAQVGMLSRELAPDEMGLHEIMMARDGIAIIVHPSNPVDDLELSQVQAIFSGQVTRWSQVGGVDRPIHVITREEGSGTRSSFDEMVMRGLEVTSGAVVQDSNGAVRETVAGDPSAIGYISLGLVDKRVKGLRISGIAPTAENVKAGAYSIARPFLFVTRDEPGGMVKEFIDFMLSPEPQAVLAREGLVPVR